MKIILIAALLLVLFVNVSAAPSKYLGQEQREIKALLSDQQALHYDQLRGYANGHNAHNH